MSTASDIAAFEHSVEPAPAETLFRDKKWTDIQDSTSNTGQYAGQIQFNLSTISSQAAFVNWQKAIIELPVKLQILNGGSGSVTPTTAASYDQLIPKAGSWQFIDSVQVVVDGVTVQTNQIHENVNTQFKAITEWDYNYYLKNASTSLFSLDDYEPFASNAPQSLDNVATSDFMTATNNVGEFGMANTVVNKGARERAAFSALDQQSTKLAFDVMGSSANIQAVSKAQVYVAPASAVAVGAPFYVAHYLACVKLADICDYFKKCPMQKNTRGFIYINCNSSSTNIVTTGTAGVLTPARIASISNNMNFGNTCPIMWNLNSATGNAGYGAGNATGLTLPASAVTLTVTADINGTSTPGSNLTPSQAFSRLLVPTYSPNPSADNALIQKKTFRYFERVTNKFTVLPNQSFTWTVSGTTADTINPFRSPLTTIPATTSPFASLKNLQVTVGNIPIWNNPVSFGYDLFVQEMSKSGVDGGLDDVTSAGLLSQRLWESLYRFIAVDIGRRLPSEDGAQKSIVISGTSNTIMNGFFTDNQTKQKAYDRYYNAMAKSDFVQGAKLKAKIQQQALDDASSDSLANLFQQVMGKSRDYDYDQITSKLTKKAPPVVKGEDVRKDKKQTKVFAYVPEQTDTQSGPKDSQFSYEEMINDAKFKKHMNEMDYTN
ncbi:hypothetical protein PC117_g8605 [Phytophthora cactorum]|uniref:Uncharacterized protein n=2 Tax=Phytophthora cactorum TaxID=29920 RepID=A0A8T1E175_9STRA|nr:hypothetical protein PC117_g8605 [Phytophthora cactorum]